MRTFIRANHKIRVPNVRCVGPEGEMLGVMSTRDAMQRAHEAGMDLVEISPNADPPVCRIMDFGKFRYDESIRQKRVRKQQHLHNKSLKEVKFHANVADHDYVFKVEHIKAFIAKGHKVKVSLQFRGRENAHRELGLELIKRVLSECEDVCTVDMAPKIVGRQVIAMVGPKSGKT